MDVVYIRYVDDIILLCKTKRSLNRCRRRMMEVLAERKLTLSRKKSRMGDITKPFHFLGIDYPGTQPLDNTNAEDNSCVDCVSYIRGGGGYFLHNTIITNRFALCRTRAHCEKPANKSK